MNVVRHQHIDVNIGSTLPGRCVEDREKTLVIGLRSKNVHLVDTALNDMVRHAGDLQSEGARHVEEELHDAVQHISSRFCAYLREDAMPGSEN